MDLIKTNMSVEDKKGTKQKKRGSFDPLFLSLNIFNEPWPDWNAFEQIPIVIFRCEFIKERLFLLDYYIIFGIHR